MLQMAATKQSDTLEIVQCTLKNKSCFTAKTQRRKAIVNNIVCKASSYSIHRKLSEPERSDWAQS